MDPTERSPPPTSPTRLKRAEERNRKGRERSLRTRRRNAARLRTLEEECSQLEKENELLRELLRCVRECRVRDVARLLRSLLLWQGRGGRGGSVTLEGGEGEGEPLIVSFEDGDCTLSLEDLTSFPPLDVEEIESLLSMEGGLVQQPIDASSESVL